MSIETLLQNLITAVEANTAALGGAKASATSTAATKPATPAKTAAKPTKVEPTHTRDELAALTGELKELSGGTDEPKALVKEFGKVEKSKDIPDELIDTVYDAFAAKIAEYKDAV